MRSEICQYTQLVKTSFGGGGNDISQLVYSSGCPRTLLVLLILEIEYHRGEILNLFATKDELLRVPINSVGRYNSARVESTREKSVSLLAIKMQGTNRSGEGGEEPAM